MKWLILILLFGCKPDYKCVNGKSYVNISGAGEDYSHYVPSAHKECLSELKGGE